MSDYSDGFLSPAIDAVRQQVRERYARHWQLFALVNKECVAAQHSVDIHPTDQREVLAAVLFARTISSTQAAIIVLERGLVAQSRILLRSSLETLFQLAAIAVKPEYVQKLIDAHDADRRTAADRVLQWTSEHLVKAVQSEISREELHVLLADKTPGRNLRDIARAGDLEEWYFTLYALLSFPAHGALSDLTTHVVQGTDGVIESLKNEPELDDQESSWSYAIQIQNQAGEAFARVFSSVNFEASAHMAALKHLSEGAQ